MTQSNPLKSGNALRLALAASALGSVLATPVVLAQSGQDAETTELAPMLITGLSDDVGFWKIMPIVLPRS